MFKKINQYLLTQFPLLWNMRVVPVLLTCFAMHILFFIAGYVHVTAHQIQHYDSVWSVGDGSLYTMSVLLSLGLVIVWLAHYLRNNAFKNFYIIDRFFLARQFMIICLTLYASLAFFHSFHWGAEAKAASITGRTELVREANIINLAARFIPVDKGDYFKLNQCGSLSGISFNEDYNYFDTTLGSYNDSSHMAIRAVMNDPDAFLFTNYCEGPVSFTTYKGFRPMNEQIRIGNSWVEHKEKDSIRSVITEALRICNKYGISSQLHVDSLLNDIFGDSLKSVSRTIASYEPTTTITSDFFGESAVETLSTTGKYRLGSDYFQIRQLRSVLSFIERCHENENDEDGEGEFQTIFIYVVLCLAILLFCYRLFTKRVFLFSLVGAIVWAIIFFFFIGGARSEIAGLGFLLLLFGICLLLSVIGAFGKTFRGLCLNWHLWLLPFVVMIIVHLIREDYNSHFSYRYDLPFTGLTDAERQARYPFGYWVDSNVSLILRVNIAFVVLYVSLAFSRLARNWHVSPDE